MIEKIRKTTTSLGILSQLYSNRMNRLLRDHDLNTAQFALFNHLARHSGRPQTLSELTAAMELNQPAVSKIVTKFSKVGWVVIEKDLQDSRKKWVSITEKGGQTVKKVMQHIGPDVARWFKEWSEDDMDQFDQQLNKLSAWLDDNRLE